MKLISRELQSIKSQVVSVHRSTNTVISRFREAVERRSILSRRHETLLLLQLAVKAHDHIRRLLDVANAPFVAGDGLPGPASEMVPGNQYPTGAAAKGNKKQLSSSSNLLIMRYRQAVGYNKRRSCGKHKPGKRQEVSEDRLRIRRTSHVLERAARELARLRVAVKRTEGFDISQRIKVEMGHYIHLFNFIQRNLRTISRLPYRS